MDTSNIPDPQDVIDVVVQWGVAVFSLLSFTIPVIVIGMHFYATFNDFKIPGPLNGIAVFSVIAAIVVILSYYLE